MTVTATRAPQHLRVALPGVIVAVSWSGFWLYLGALDLLGIQTRTVYSVLIYGTIALALAAVISMRRDLLIQRLQRSSPIARVWLASASLLALMFAYGALVTGHGPLAHRLLGVFVVSTIPTTIAVAALSWRDLAHVRAALVILGLLFVVINLFASRHGAPLVGRFSPIENLDPISASLISVVACIAALTYRFKSVRATSAQAAACFAFAAAAMLNGSRGPIVALIVAVVFAVLFDRRLTMIALAAAIAVGIVVGSKLEVALIGQPPALTSLANEARSPNKPQQPKETSVAISSLHIRQEWLSSAIRKIPQRPVLGHGIGTLVDDTPEAAAMGIKGELVYPHNDAVEAFYSLGAVGGILFALVVGLPLIALWRNRRVLNLPLLRFVPVLFVFALAECNFSGEIGTDVILWSLAAFAIVALDHPAGVPEA